MKDNTNKQIKNAERCHHPHDDAVDPARVHDVCEKSDDGELRYAERHDAWAEAHDSPKDGL